MIRPITQTDSVRAKEKPETFCRKFIDGTTITGSNERLHNWDCMLHDFKPWFTYKHRSLYRTKSSWVITSKIRGWDVPSVAVEFDSFWKALWQLRFPKVLK